MWSLQLLGPIVLRHGGQALALPTQKSQALLLLLALDGPQHRARLAAWLWPEGDEHSARRNLRRELARLREAGAGALLLAEGDRLALCDTPGLDVPQFETLVGSGHWQDALALWRGPLADDLQRAPSDQFSDWLAARRRALAGLRRQALEALAGASQAAGRTDTALQHLGTLLQDDPLQERHHRRLMQLLADAGRREDALAQYQRCRALLAQELGVAPEAETEALAQRLRGAPAGSPPRPEPVDRLAAAELPLAGRDAEWAALHQAWRTGLTILIEGEAGIGKSRLAREFAGSLGAHALAQCRPSDAGVPYASFTRVLRQLAGQALAEAELPAWVRLELSHLLPELGPGPRRIGTAEEQRHFCEACAAAWHGLSAGSFDAVVLDDWHLADPASRALVAYILEQGREAVAAGRPGAAAAAGIFVQRPAAPGDGGRPGAAGAVRAGAADDGVFRLALGPLGPAQVYQLVQRLSGAADPQRFAQRLQRASGGNPFFLVETLRQWQGLKLLDSGPDGVWRTPFDDATQDYAELPLPDSVRNAVLARVQRLPEPVQRLLQVAAQASEPFTVALLGGACGMTEVQALDAVAQAVDAQLLRERDGAYAFEHDLVQAALDHAAPPQQRRLVHCRLALGAEAAALPAADIAHHWEAGGQPQRAVAHRMAAAQAALDLYADALAQQHWQAALDDGPSLAQRVRILGQRWPLLARQDDLPGLLALVADLDALCAQARGQPGADALALEAALHAAEILGQAQRNEDALHRLQACLDSPALTPSARAQALRVQSQALSRLGRADEASAAVQAALAAGGLAPLQQGDLWHALSYSAFLRGAPQASLEHARQALAVWQSVGARRQAAQAQASIGRALDMLDEREAAWAALEQAYAQAAELRMVDLQRIVANNLAINRLHHGGPARALQVIGEARALSPHFSMRAMPVFYLGILVQAQAQLGALGRALDLAAEALALAQALDETLTLADCVSMSLDLHTQLDDEAGAQRLLATLHGRSLDGLGYFATKLNANRVRHALRRGRLGQARALLQAQGDVDALAQPPDRHAARLCHAELALAEGDAAAALRWLAPLADAVLYTELQARSCALRLAAHEALGQADPTALALADAALAGQGQGRQLPALAALGLRQVRLAAALRLGDGTGAAALQAAIAAEIARLADSLGPHEALSPALQAQAPAGPGTGRA